MTTRDQILSGRHAVLAALHHRPGDVLRLFFDPTHLAELKPILRDLAQRRALYRELPEPELARIAGTRAHQGLVLVLRRPSVRPVLPAQVATWARGPSLVLALDGVGNPLNLGAIARTAAFLGVRDLLLSEQGTEAIGSGAAYRTAEGALESLTLWRSSDLAQDLHTLQAAGGLAVALAVDGTLDLPALRQRGPAGLVLVAGAEEDGVRPQVQAACGARVRIDGDGVQSLNVGVAVGIALSWLLVAR